MSSKNSEQNSSNEQFAYMVLEALPEMLDYDPVPRLIPVELIQHPPLGHIAFMGDFDSVNNQKVEEQG